MIFPQKHPTMENIWHKGSVIHGNANGRKWHYPTINLSDIHPVMSFDAGVYAARVKVAEQMWSAMLYIGNRPTLNLSKTVVEIHLLDFQGDLYGESVEFAVLQRVRGERKFASVEDLAAQLQRDEMEVRRLLG